MRQTSSALITDTDPTTLESIKSLDLCKRGKSVGAAADQAGRILALM